MEQCDGIEFRLDQLIKRELIVGHWICHEGSAKIISDATAFDVRQVVGIDGSFE